MEPQNVTAPDGAVWRVRVAWMPRWRALARRFGGWRRKRNAGSPDRRTRGRGGGLDFPDLSGADDDLFVAVVVIIGMIVFGLLFWWLLLPLLLLAVDGIVVVVLLALAVPARVLFRRPWTVEAISGTERIAVPVVGWRRARDVRDELAARLARGDRSLPRGELDSLPWHR